MPVKSIPQDAQDAIDEMVKRRHNAQPKSFDEQLELLTTWGQQYRKVVATPTSASAPA